MLKRFAVTLSLGTLIILSASPAAIAASTWIPEFQKGQSVYLDPYLKNHPVAPFEFSPKLQDALSKPSEQGVQYYIVAAQQGDENVPQGVPLGVAKVDELMPKWAGNPDFPRGNYAVIFWVRKSANLEKGSVGANVGSFLRDTGMSPDVLSSSSGPIMPVLASKMPADPEGAMLGITQRMETYAASSIALSEAWSGFVSGSKDILGKLLLALLGSAPVVAIATLSARTLASRKKVREEAADLLQQWEKLIATASTRYLDVETLKLPNIKMLPLDHPNVSRQFNGLIKDLASFMAKVDAAESLVKRAKVLLERSPRKALNALTKGTVSINKAAIPDALSSLKEGIDGTQDVTPIFLQKALEREWDNITGQLCRFQDYHQCYSMTQDNASFEKYLADSSREYCRLEESLMVYKLNDGGSFVSSFECPVYPIEYEGKLLSPEDLIEGCKLSRAKGDLDSLLSQHVLLEELFDRNVSLRQELSLYKEYAEKRFDSFPKDSRQLQKLMSSAQSTLSGLAVNYPNDDFFYLEEAYGHVQGYLEAGTVESAYKGIVNSYRAGRFKEASNTLKNGIHQYDIAQERLSGIIKAPALCAERQGRLMQEYANLTRRNEKLSVAEQYSDRLENSSQISLSDFNDHVNSLKLHVEAAEQRHAEAQAAAERAARVTRYSRSSSSSSYGSSSSGSSYGGSSGGGSFGGSSGGGDY